MDQSMLYNENGEYLGIYMGPLYTEKMMKQQYRHPIFLYNPDTKLNDKLFMRLEQTVNVYEHNLEDFVLNSRKIIKHYEKYIGNGGMGIFTMGQSIRFRVVPDQEPFQISLFAFLMNYTMLICPVLCSVDLSNWKPFLPTSWTSGAWRKRMDEYITMCRPYGNIRKLGEYISWSKYLMNRWVSKVGHRLGLSISNNEFIEVAKRSKNARESITSTFDVPKKMSPSEIEKLSKSRTSQLLDIIGEQKDLSISVYTKTGLFNPIQFQEFAVNIPFKPDLYGNTIPFKIQSNVIMGINDPLAHMIDAYGARKAEIVKLNVSDAGAFERSLCMLMSNIRYVDVDYECDSRHFRKKLIDSNDALDRLDGRVATLNPKSDEYFIIDPNNVDLIGKLLYIKTPISCTHPRRKEGYICSACYGKMLANMNRDIHIGRIAGMNLADDMEQTLLSAKHALATDTNDIEFDKEFNTYFTTYSCQIFFNQEMIDSSAEGTDEFNHLYLEFNLNNMKKHQDGEGRQYDRSITEIVIYDERDDTRIVIQEQNGVLVYLSQEFVNDYFLNAIKHKTDKDIVRIPFRELIDGGKVCCEVLFEYQYKNNDIPGALLKLRGILTKTDRINQYQSFDECLDAISPLFVKGGIHLPDLQSELLISQLIFSPEGGPVDWSKEHVEYIFYTIDKAIHSNSSPITSILYQESSRQVAGAYNTYSKSGTSGYDYFIYDYK